MNHQIKIIVLFLIFFNILCLDQLTTHKEVKCQGVLLEQKVPQKFALLTMTYNRKGRMDVLNSYLQHYGNMKCEGFDNIYIVWNNQETPQSMGYGIQNKWINKVIITKTPTNKIDWKYSIPYDSQQQIFLALDDDQRTSCTQMMKLFNSWRTYAVGKIGPLYSFAERAQTYNYQSNSFEYLDPASYGDRKTHYFSVALMGCGFVSRHFMDLYYSDLQVIVKMRRVVQQKQNCQDILMNFIVSYFYPQLVSKSMHIQFFNAGQKFSGLSKRKNHRTDRHECLNTFSQILGFNPLRKIKYEDKFKDNIKRMDFTCLIKQKKQYLQRLFKRKTIEQIFSQNQAPTQVNPNDQQQSNSQKPVQSNSQKPAQLKIIDSIENNNQNNPNHAVIQSNEHLQSPQKTQNIQVPKQNIQNKVRIEGYSNGKRNQQIIGITKNQKQSQNSDFVSNFQKSKNEKQKNSSFSGVLPLQIQILVLSTIVLLLLIMIVIKKSQGNNFKQKKAFTNISIKNQAKQKLKKTKKIKAESNLIQDIQNTNPINNQLQIQ